MRQRTRALQLVALLCATTAAALALDPVDQARYPSYVERGELALRPQLALRVLDSGERLTPDAVLAIKFTPRLLLAERVKPALVTGKPESDPGFDRIEVAREEALPRCRDQAPPQTT